MESVPPVAAASPTQLSARCFAGLRVARYAIALRAADAARLAAFSGTTLRGAFGYALKRAVCVMPHGDCAKCLVADRCTYPFVFETAPRTGTKLESQQNAPHPFTLEPPVLPVLEEDRTRDGLRLAAGEAIHFGLTLVGRAIESLPYLVFALHGMAETGLGTGRARFDLTGVESLDPAGGRRALYDAATGRLDSRQAAGAPLDQWIAARLAALPPDAGAVRLRFLTPARIKSDDQLQSHPGFDLLARNLLRRVSMLTELYGDGPLDLDYRALLASAAAVAVRASELRWRDVARYSTRQQAAMRMGGFTGELEFAGAALPAFLPLLAAGELLGIGKGTSFGLGRYEIVAAQPDAMIGRTS
jgi:CRISPR-associated endoribonuclease Cas6